VGVFYLYPSVNQKKFLGKFWYLLLMKYIITENRLKKILDNELGGNLEWVEMITSEHQIPHEFDYHFSPNLRRKYLKDGPMYLLKIKGNLFLVQPKKNHSLVCVPGYGWGYEDIVWDFLGVPPFISLMDLIYTYLPEKN
jgi:hypothetical protein